MQLPPHPSGLQPPGVPPVTGSSSGLLALGALGGQAHLAVKDEKNHHELDHRGAPGRVEAGGRGWGSSSGPTAGAAARTPGPELADGLESSNELLVHGDQSLTP